MTPSRKQEKIYDICWNKYHLYTRPFSNDNITYWYKQGADPIGEVLRYDFYNDTITIATMVIANTCNEGKLLFCMNEQIEFEDFEQALDKVMVEYKKALVRQKIQEINNDFQV